MPLMAGLSGAGSVIGMLADVRLFMRYDSSRLSASSAGLAQLLGLIFKIIQAAATAHHNKVKCDDLALRVYAIAEHLQLLPDREAMGSPVVGLRDALEEAHKLITQSRRRRYARAIFQPESFNDVNKRIDSFLLVIMLIRNVPVPPNGTTVHPHSSAVPAASHGEWQGGRKFTLARIEEATNNFADVLGEGDSGKVYKGILDGGTEVAVKRLKNGLRRPAEDVFGAELAILRPLSHKHVVRLVGSCADGEERVLVYDHMDNGTLRDHLQNSSTSKLASSWRRRLQVLLGAACAIEHLHCHARPQLIHGNVTSSNILLDRSWNPRVSGFGSSVWRLSQGGQAVDVSPTHGYQDPEYSSSSTRLLKPATDVFSFGVVMLEVLTGKEPVVDTSVWGHKMLVTWAMTSIGVGKLGEVLDRRPATEPTPDQRRALQLVTDTAARCLCPRGDDRPAISDVVAKLNQALHLIC